MKILRVLRMPINSKDYADPESLIADGIPVPALSGIIVSTAQQLAALVQSQLPPGEALQEDELTPDRALSPPADEENMDPFFRVYFLHDKDYQMLPFFYLVELDEETSARREQVSLTLPSSLLTVLRSRADRSGKSLSRYIDQLLTTSVQKEGFDVHTAYEEALNDIQESITRSREKIALAMASNRERQDFYKEWALKTFPQLQHEVSKTTTNYAVGGSNVKDKTLSKADEPAKHKRQDDRPRTKVRRALSRRQNNSES